MLPATTTEDNIAAASDQGHEEEFAAFEDKVGLVSPDEIIQNKISKSVRDLRNFLDSNQFLTEKGDQQTNIINVAEKKTYNIPADYMEEFFTHLEKTRVEQCSMHFSERQETDKISHSGMMLDFDRYQRTREPQLTDYHFESICLRVVSLLKEFVDFNTSTDDAAPRVTIRAFIIRKPEVVQHERGVKLGSPVYKDGFHILFPEVQIIKGLKKHIIGEIINRSLMTPIFRDIDNMEPAERMVDKMAASNPVHFFGSSKPGAPAYLLTHAYEISLGEMDNIRISPIDVGTLLSGFAEVKTSKARPAQQRQQAAAAPALIPINLVYELSLCHYTAEFRGAPTWLQKRHYNYKPAFEAKIQLLIEKTSRDIIADDEILANENSVDILTMGNAEAKYIKNLLGLIDISYATEYEKWFKVICALAHTSPQYKPLAMWFSQRVPEKWSPASVDRVWGEAMASRGVKNPVSKASIIFWAQQSSPQKFRELNKENYVELLAKYVYENEGRVEHAMAARIVHNMLAQKFVVDVGYNEKTGRVGYCWFEFVAEGQSMKHGEIYKWRRELEPDNIHLFISEHLPKVYAEQAQRIRERKDAAKNEAEAKFLSGVERTFRQYMSKLSNDGFQTGIVRQAQYRFRQRGFNDELDQDDDLIGVGNGILKVGAEPKFIRGFHEYKVSRYTEVDYVDRPFNPYESHIKKLLQWANDIFPEPDVNLFMWIHAATGLDFCESACILLLLVGGGQNGKTSWAKMVHETLGQQYCAAGKPALLTSPFERGENANSAQMQMKDKRWFYFDEFNKSEEINVARMKSLVNPNWQSGRDLREKQSNFRNTCNPVAFSNYDFMFPANTNDHGTWRRIYYYRNKAKFSKNPNKDNPYEKLADDKWITVYPKDPAFKTAFLECLVHYYKIYCAEFDRDLKNIPVPTIQRETEDFRNRQDTLNRFITQMIVKSPHADPISLQTLTTKYCEWYAKNIKPVVLPATEVQPAIENSRLSSAFENRGVGTKLLYGHRIKSSVEEPLQPGEEELVQIKNTDGTKINLTVGEDGLTTQRQTVRNADGTLGVVGAAAGPPLHSHHPNPHPHPPPHDDFFVKDLVRNTPLHIQRTEAKELDLAAALEQVLGGVLK